MDNGITYERDKPCVKCGSHTFYLKELHCRNCSIRNARQWREKAMRDPEYREKQLANTRKWNQRNREYISLANKARYQLRKEKALLAKEAA